MTAEAMDHFAGGLDAAGGRDLPLGETPLAGRDPERVGMTVVRQTVLQPGRVPGVTIGQAQERRGVLPRSEDVIDEEPLDSPPPPLDRERLVAE